MKIRTILSHDWSKSYLFDGGINLLSLVWASQNVPKIID